MRTLAACLVAAAALHASAAFGACEMPSLVTSIPDGAVATEQELLAAQVEIRAYIDAMGRYIACQNEEMEGARNNATANYLFLMSARIESAHKEIDRIATEFNDQVNAFRSARQTGPGLR